MSAAVPAAVPSVIQMPPPLKKSFPLAKPIEMKPEASVAICEVPGTGVPDSDTLGPFLGVIAFASPEKKSAPSRATPFVR